MNKHRFFASIALCTALSSCALIPFLQKNSVATDFQAATPSPTPDLVAQALDRGDVAEAILQIETRWRKQFEEYFEGKFTTQLLPAADIARSLNQIKQRSGRRSALLYA
ncbi:hypothetical protein IQ250_24605, partial [Pseudanabaenaceae cyanobacterium LEGE 13415]|nr:hypothetical protein [Pseudanabaenaceae cyanobacterium LEGE 13415]